MANSVIPFVQGGQNRCGNTPVVFDRLRTRHKGCGAWLPSMVWQCVIDYTDVDAGTQTALVTIPGTGWAPGRVVLTFSGGGLVAPVEVFADGQEGEDEDIQTAALEVALDAAVLADLEGVLADVDSTANATTLTFEPGIGLVTVVATYEVAQTFTIDWSTAIHNDGTYVVTIDGGDLVAAESTNVVRATGTTTSSAVLAQAFEAALEANTDLDTVLVSADDSSATNLLVFLPGWTDIEVEISGAQGFTATFGGTPTDGTYLLTFDHPSLVQPIPIPVVRAAGSPATSNDLAVAMEAAIEANIPLRQLIMSADDTTGVNAIVVIPGVEGLTVVASAPAPGTLVVADVSATVDETTPAGPAVTVSTSLVLSLSDIAVWPFPARVNREEVALNVTTAWGADRTITVGDAGDPDGVLGSTPVDLDTEGWVAQAAAVAEYEHRPEPAWVPTATLVLGESFELTEGSCELMVVFSKYPDAL